jgi:3'(2'), 5'-bisphosphate nucleotidase
VTGFGPDNGVMSDVALASKLAHAAGVRLLAVRGAATGVTPDELRGRGDAEAQAVLAAGLAAARPGEAVLSEEAIDDRRRLDSDRVWIIDPLDGTREFSEGRHDWAVHVALWQGGDLVAGAVALPSEDTVLVSAPPSVVPARQGGRLRLAVSRSRPPQLATDLAEVLDFELVPLGSAGYKIAAVIRGEVDAYVHGGGQYEWDSAAPVAVARAAGLHTSRLDGSPLRYNQADVLLPDLIVCRPELGADIVAAIGRLSPLTAAE